MNETLEIEDWAVLLLDMEATAQSLSTNNVNLESQVCHGNFYRAIYLVAERSAEFTKAWYYLCLSNKQHLRKHSRGSVHLNSDIEQNSPLNWHDTLEINYDNLQFDIVPIFVVGLPNSGALALAEILDSFPEIVSMSARPQYFTHLAAVTDHTLRMGAYALYRLELSRILSELHKNSNKRGWNHHDALNNCWRGLYETYSVLVKHALGSGVKCGNSALGDIKYIVDYSTSNFAYISELLSIFPRSKVLTIDMIDPINSVLANFRHAHFGEIGSNVGYNLWAFDLNSTVERVSMYRETIDVWKYACDKKEMDISVCSRIVHLSLENLIHFPGDILETISRKLNVKSNPNMCAETNIAFKSEVNAPFHVDSSNVNTEYVRSVYFGYSKNLK